MERGEYEVKCLDADGFEIGPNSIEDNLKEAKKRAIQWKNEYSDCHKCEVYNYKGEVIYDVFRQ